MLARHDSAQTPERLLPWNPRTAMAMGALLYALAACTTEVAVDAAGVPSASAPTASRFAVNLYGTCSDRTAPADRALMPSSRKDLEVTCVDTSDRIIGIEPAFVRVSSPDGYSGQLFVRCEHPEPRRWEEAIAKPSRTALVAGDLVLSKFHTTGNSRLGCGIFTAESTTEAVAMCSQMMRAWKKDPSACERSCTGADPLTTTCVER
jgi:hypothetical protein